MPISLIAKIYDDFRSEFKNYPQPILEFFTKNTIAFNNINTFSNADDLRYYIELTSWYADSLFKKDRYNDTFNAISKFLPIIDQGITDLEAIDLKNDWYYYILFLEGTASYNLRNFKTSTPIFSELVRIDPQNEKYRNWLRHSKHRQMDWISILVTIVSILLLLTGDILSSYTKNYHLKQFFPVVAIILVTSYYGYELYMKREFEKIKTIMDMLTM